MSSIVRVAIIGVLWLVLTGRSHLEAQSNLKATVTGPKTVALTWTASTSATEYWVQRALGTGQFAIITAAKVTGTAYTDAAAPAGSALKYRIKGTSKKGPAAFSNQVSVSTAGASPSTASAPPSVVPAAAPVAATPAPAAAAPAPTAAAPAPTAAAPASAAAAPAPVTATLAPVPVALEPVSLTPASPPPGMPTVAPTVSKADAVRMQPLRERPLRERPLPTKLALPAAEPAPAPASTVTPVNPSGFIAKQTGDGQVQLSWRPIDGVSYYVLLGPGIPDGGTRVTGATTFTAVGVPPGSHEWAVASYYEPGPVSTVASEFPRTRLTTDVMLLSGWADLHTHPMINLAFGGKLVHGGVDVGSLLPQDLTCHGPTRAMSMEHALGEDRPSHGGWNAFNFPCGDELRKLLIGQFQQGNHALVTNNPGRGYPDFYDWPKWNDITHQKMWYEWIRRARDGGLRVMVALATNNKTLADAVSGNGDGPTDDKASGDLQLTEIKSFVARHNDFMEVALGAADVKRIVEANKIAVVLGVELDNIGNFNQLPPGMLAYPGPAEAIIPTEIQRLYDEGVRYVLPIHVMDNAFGGTAIYKDDFNTANLRESGHFWEIECADVGDDITHVYTEVTDPLRAAGAFVKLGLDPFRHSGPGPVCDGTGGKSRGNRNVRGLTLQGIYAIKQMMKRGMIVDIDHMSHHSAEKTLELGEQFGYPIVSGHSGIRGQAGADAENSRTRRQLERISKLHGMFGLGSDGVDRSGWANQYQNAMTVMGYPNSDTSKAIYRNGAISFGSDLNGLVKGPMPGGGDRVKYGAFAKSTSGSKSWDYNTEGVAHYGMMADFVVDLRTAASNEYTGAEGIPLGVNGAELVDNHLNRSANYFWQMWVLAEARKGNVQ
jgi:microsomal dipeptidase-like Zn-dependent dipeptidase